MLSKQITFNIFPYMTVVAILYADTASQFSSLEHNPIVSAFDSLLDEVYNNKVNGNEE